MGFFRSIITLAAICLCITFVYFFGHALSVHSSRPIMYGAGLLLLGVAIIAFLVRDRAHS